MVRLKGIDSLKDVEGKLVPAFDTATLTMLSSAFLARQPDEPAREAAKDALTALRVAAGGVRSSENAFNERAARPSPATTQPHHMKHLRSAGELTALRELRQARESMLDLDPAKAPRLVRAIEKRFTAPTGRM